MKRTGSNMYKVGICHKFAFHYTISATVLSSDNIINDIGKSKQSSVDFVEFCGAYEKVLQHVIWQQHCPRPGPAVPEAATK